MLNTSTELFDADGNCIDPALRTQLETVGRQVTEFAVQRALSAA
jgi:FMN reductase